MSGRTSKPSTSLTSVEPHSGQCSRAVSNSSPHVVHLYQTPGSVSGTSMSRIVSMIPMGVVVCEHGSELLWCEPIALVRGHPGKLVGDGSSRPGRPRSGRFRSRCPDAALLLVFGRAILVVARAVSRSLQGGGRRSRSSRGHRTRCPRGESAVPGSNPGGDILPFIHILRIISHRRAARSYVVVRSDGVSGSKRGVQNQCRHCDTHVSYDFTRVFGDNEGTVRRCPSCAVAKSV